MKTTTVNAVSIAKELAGQFATRADEADRLGRLPVEDIQALRESGYLSLNIPQEYGGADLSMRDCLAAQLELAQGSSSTALVAGMQMQVFGDARQVKIWSEETYERLCRAAVAGGLFNSAATEPKLGSPSRGTFFVTTAEPSDDGFMINGHKTWITGGKALTHLLVGLTLNGKPAVILVEGDQPGLEWVETWGDGLSLRASDSHDLYFRNVWVSRENLIERGNPRGTRLNIWYPLVISATYLGIAIAARNAVIQFALERVPTALGKPIATLPKIQSQIGQIDLALQAARLLMLDVARRETGLPFSRVAAVKHFTIKVANDVAQQALHIAGGTSITRQLPLERYFRDVQAGFMHPPAGDTALEIIGRAAIEQFKPGPL